MNKESLRLNAIPAYYLHNIVNIDYKLTFYQIID
jgi:hypothetical protein